MASQQDESSPLDDSTAIIEEAYALLRSWTRGQLRFDEHIMPCRFVHAPDGRLVAPVMVATLQTADTVLMIPDETAPTLELLLSLEPFDEDGPHGALADRWRIYHGEEEDINWALFGIDMARMSGMIIDGDALLRCNLLQEDEPALCRAMNELGTNVIRKLCSKKLGVEAEEPLVVGVDPMGVDIRARFEVLRIPFGVPIDLPEDIVTTIRRWAGA